MVLVFDADEGGETGVDRAMEVFVSHDVDLKVATLPPGWIRATFWPSKERYLSRRP